MLGNLDSNQRSLPKSLTQLCADKDSDMLISLVFIFNSPSFLPSVLEEPSTDLHSLATHRAVFQVPEKSVLINRAQSSPWGDPGQGQ